MTLRKLWTLRSHVDQYADRVVYAALVERLPGEPVASDVTVDLEKHKARALRAIAEHICSTNLTDGFCGPRDEDGKLSCIGQKGARPKERNCVVRARGMLQAMDTVGIVPVWVHDKTLRVEPPKGE